MEDELDAGRSRRRAARAQRDGEFTIERIGPAGAKTTEQEAGRSEPPTVDPGRADAERSTSPSYPARVAAKYYVVPGREEQAAERRAFADERGDYLVFRDDGTRLSTRREEAAIVRDLVAIAQHRQWTAIQVTGSTAFRRKAWLEATERGIAIHGYEPSDLDRQAAAKREVGGRPAARGNLDAAASNKGPASSPTRDARSVPTAQVASEDLNLTGPGPDAGREGGNHPPTPQPRRASADRSPLPRPTPDLTDPRRPRAKAPERIIAAAVTRIGEHGAVRGEEGKAPAREAGSEREHSQETPPSSAMPQELWRRERDRLLTSPREAIIEDPNLAAAHSHLIVLDRVLTRAFPRDVAARQAVLDVARDRLAHHLAAGRSLRRAEYAMPTRSMGESRDGPEAGWRRAVEPSGPRRRSVREKER